MTPEEINNLIDARVDEKLGKLFKIDRYTFSKLIQMLDGRNFQFGRSTGTKHGTATDQLQAFYGVTPVNQPDTVADATDAADVILRCNDIIDRLQELGLIA